MIPALLTIKTLIQQADKYASTASWTCLKKEWPHCYLINDADMARDILKDENLLPEQIFDLWKLINRLDKKSLPRLTQYFQKIPLLLSGQDHVSARNALRMVYQNIEQFLEFTLKESNHYFFSNWKEKKRIEPTFFILSYIDFINRSILARELSVNVHDIPAFEGIQLFQFMPSANELIKYEKKLDELVSFIEKKLHDLHRSQDDVWPLVSVAVMGQEPLSGALAHGLMHPAKDGSVWSGESLAFHSAPASVFSRVSQKKIIFGDLHLDVGDVVVVSPIICNQFNLHKNGTSDRSMSFGHGAHTCTGRKITTKIIDIFFKDINQYTLDLNLKTLELRRDFGLTPIKKQEKLDFNE